MQVVIQLVCRHIECINVIIPRMLAQAAPEFVSSYFVVVGDIRETTTRGAKRGANVMWHDMASLLLNIVKVLLMVLAEWQTGSVHLKQHLN